MAKDASIKTPETTLPDDPANGSISQPSDQFYALIDWVKALEDENKSTRVHAILTSDANAPEFVRLQYSYPPCKIGKIDGYQRGDGSVVLFEPV